MLLLLWSKSGQPITVDVFVFVFVVDAEAVVVVDDFVAIQKLAIKIGQNRVKNSWDIHVVVVVVVVVFAFVLVHIVVVDPRKQPLKFGQNCISNSINDVEFPEVVGCGGGWVVV